MPGALQVVAGVLPLTYFAGPFGSVMVEGTGLAANSGDLVTLLAWTVGRWIIAVRTCSVGIEVRMCSQGDGYREEEGCTRLFDWLWGSRCSCW